ncbi:hypothetical protein ICC18_11200 [Paenibacillus sp. WST5]|uniref:Uncharacterized protein n=2 Tax=Paenibacillus sedimenti TaxID=2770274 RepID=A0A926QJG5_9BACL|nr:hypothetical protein [Paenibacillus sedimenti]
MSSGLFQAALAASGPYLIRLSMEREMGIGPSPLAADDESRDRTFSAVTLKD